MFLVSTVSMVTGVVLVSHEVRAEGTVYLFLHTVSMSLCPTVI